MAQILQFRLKPKEVGMTTDQMWMESQPYYEKAYRIRFRSRPTDEQIKMLYEKMKKLSEQRVDHFDQKPILKDRFLKSQGFMEETKEDSTCKH